MTLSSIKSDKSYVVDYVQKGFRSLAKKELIMFAHNIGNHWVLVVIIPKWTTVLYFDSLRSRSRGHSLLEEIIDEVFDSYSIAYGMTKKKLLHVTKFSCHQQRPGNNECGFYTAHHMSVARGLLDIDDLKEFEMMTNHLVKMS